MTVVKGFWSTLTRNKMYLLMISPMLIFFFIFSYVPMVGIYYAFTNYDFSKGLFGSDFVGWDNFKFLFVGGSDAIIWKLTRNTILYNLAFLLLGNLLQIIVAITISELPGKFIKKTSQSIMFLPYFISYVIVAVFIYHIFNYDYGLANQAIKTFHGEPVNFYAEPGAWKYILVSVALWKGVGYGTVIYLATLAGIDRTMYEAAELDGANIFQKIRYITLPSLKPTFFILLLFNIGTMLKGQFDLFYQVIGRNGLLYDATDIIDTYVYRSLTVNFDIGLGTAAGLYQSFFGLVLILIVNKIIKRINPDYALF
ncbi:ABC transporter permease [Bacillus sp. NPDC077027]|uniref:ABC transporter permease n=1 Tax=Bacillus sp. NPDC077027 TaxID=3390548 RepID=UPI003D07844A